MSISTMVIEFKKKKTKHGQIVKTIFSRKWYFSEIVHTQFCFDMLYAVKSSEVETESKK